MRRDIVVVSAGRRSRVDRELFQHGARDDEINGGLATLVHNWPS